MFAVDVDFLLCIFFSALGLPLIVTAFFISFSCGLSITHFRSIFYPRFAHLIHRVTNTRRFKWSEWVKRQRETLIIFMYIFIYVKSEKKGERMKESKSREFMNLHKPCFSAFRTDDVSVISDETTSNQWCFAACTNEAIVMPVPVFKWNETRSTNT